MTFPQVQRFGAEILGVSETEIAPGTLLSKRNGFDATSLAKLVMKCEQAFNITIHDEDVLDFSCVADLAAYIEGRLADGRDDYVQPSDQAREAWYYQ